MRQVCGREGRNKKEGIGAIDGEEVRVILPGLAQRYRLNYT